MINELASKVVDSVFDVLVIVDESLHILDCNSSVTDLGYTKDELLGKPITDLTIDNAGFRRAIPELAKAAREGKRELRRFECLTKDGSHIWADVAVQEIDATEALDYLITLHDVTERALARKELEEQKAKLESILTETETLRKEADDNRFQLQLANEQLAKRQAVTEKALEEEQRFRLSSQKTGFQKDLSRMLVALVALAIVIPYVSALLPVETKILDGSNNLALLLLQVLGIAVGSLFGQNTSKQGGMEKDA